LRVFVYFYAFVSLVGSSSAVAWLESLITEMTSCVDSSRPNIPVFVFVITLV